MSPPLPSPRSAPGRKRLVPLRSWQQRSSPLSRYALLAYVAVVVDASLFPFSGWRELGLAPYDYLFADWPARPLPFDLLVNALGYLPLGFIAGLALHPRVRGVAAVIVATLLCAALSIHLEALQTYLPSRVASKVDVLTNVSGGFVGALLAARFAHALLDTGRLRVWRTRWFASDASRGLVLALVWFGALIYPDAFVFGTGGLLKAFDPSGSDFIAAAVGLVDQNDPRATAARFQLAEAAVAGTTMFGAGLMFMNLLRHGLSWWRRFLLPALFVAATVLVAVLAREFLFDDANSWPPLTPGARSGIAFAFTGIAVATVLPDKARWLLALIALLASLAIVNVYPDNPYGKAVSLTWTRGKLLNFYGLASGLNLVWPYLAIAYLSRHRGSSAMSGRRGEAARPKTATGSSL